MPRLGLRDEAYSDLLQNRQANLSIIITVVLQGYVEQRPENRFRAADNLFTDASTGINAIEVCELDGNFALRNLLWDGTRIITIDLENSRTDTIYFDVALMVAELLNKKILPLSKSYNAHLIRKFLQSYQQYRLNPDLLGSYVIYHLVWSYYELVTRQRSRNALKRTIMQYRKQRLRKEIKQQINLLSRGDTGLAQKNTG